METYAERACAPVRVYVREGDGAREELVQKCACARVCARERVAREKRRGERERERESALARRSPPGMGSV